MLRNKGSLFIRRSAVDKDCRVRARIFPSDLARCLVSEFLKGNGHPWRESCYLLTNDFEQVRRWRGPPPGGFFKNFWNTQILIETSYFWRWKPKKFRLRRTASNTIILQGFSAEVSYTGPGSVINYHPAGIFSRIDNTGRGSVTIIIPQSRMGEMSY